MKLWIVLIASIAALALPSSALAVKCAPPGNSGVDQYYETVPGPSCNGPPGGSGHHHGHHLPGSTGRRLAAQGATGQAVAQLVANTSPIGTAGSGASSASGSGAASNASAAGSNGTGGSGSAGAATGRQPATGTEPTAPAVNGRNLISALLHPILTGASNAGGTGVLLPIFLAGALVLMLVGLVVRRRRRPTV